MKKLETEDGYYRNGDIFSKKVFLPNDADSGKWKWVCDEEYRQWLAQQPNITDEQPTD